MQHEYYVAFFDILGFKNRLSSMGLSEMLSRYEALIETVTFLEKSLKRIFGDFRFEEAPHWSKDGDIFLVTKTRGAYASDSLLIWQHRFWPEARSIPNIELHAKEFPAATAWQFQPVPSDNFLNVCNELMCKGLEVGLPLRGGIAIGEAILDLERNIFIGQPIIDAAALQAMHEMMSTSFCTSVSCQPIPNRYAFKYDRHIKKKSHDLSIGLALDWPRHWRNTRKASVIETIKALDTNPDASHYYKNTLELVAHSEKYAGMYESIEEVSIRNNYEQFGWAINDLTAKARAVKSVPIELT